MEFASFVIKECLQNVFQCCTNFEIWLKMARMWHCKWAIKFAHKHQKCSEMMFKFRIWQHRVAFTINQQLEVHGRVSKIHCFASQNCQMYTYSTWWYGIKYDILYTAKVHTFSITWLIITGLEYLAKHTLAFCPPLSVTPFSPTSVKSPSGSNSTSLVKKSNNS